MGQKDHPKPRDSVIFAQNSELIVKFARRGRMLNHPSFFCMKDILRSLHGIHSSGKAVEMFHLQNEQGSSLLLSAYGARWISLSVADKNGLKEEVIVGPQALADLEKADAFFGCAVGRYANRIANGKFALGGKSFSLAKNLNGNVHLHGGNKGFDQYIWDAHLLEGEGKKGVAFTLTSPDGDEGYPGKLDARVSYWLSESNEVIIEYQAESDKPTVVNLTNHAYFNLCGNMKQDVLAHELQLFADQFTETDDELVPTGSLASVADNPLDFRQPKRLGADIAADDRLIHMGNGYDHNFVVRPSTAPLAPVAVVTEPTSGRKLEVFSTQPGVQLYTANWFDGSQMDAAGQPIHPRFAFCLEAQHFPDSPNHPHFPTTTLLPGQSYSHKSVYKFSQIP